MGYLRFYRRKQIIPGVRLNLSKSGPSLSFGGRGMHYTVGHHRRRTTVGIPGTGLFYTSAHSTGPGRSAPSHQRVAAPATLPHRPPTLAETTAENPGCAFVLGMVLVLAGVPLIGVFGVGVGFLAAGLFLLVVAVRTLRSPAYAAHRLLMAVESHPDHAEELLTGGLAILPDHPLLMGALAELYMHDGHLAEAAGAYHRLIEMSPGATLARGRLAECYLHLGAWAQAIPLLDLLRVDPSLTEESRLSMASHLAVCYLAQGDASQALELMRTTPLQRRTFTPALKECLFMRAATRYFLGNRSEARADIERLCAVDPTFPGIAESRSEVEGGTFVLSQFGHAVAPTHETPITVQTTAPVIPPAPSERARTAASPPLLIRWVSSR